MKPLLPVLALLGTCAAPPAATPSRDAELAALLATRVRGDRTGACIAAAVVGDQVARAVVCADAAAPPRLDRETSLEIGSVTKTMDAFLLADLIAEGKLRLDDPVAAHLPPETRLPTFQGEPIRLEHLVTHTAGLPPLPARLQPADPEDPYAGLTDQELLDSLGDLPPLTRAPGSSWAYSNFGGMLLSYVLATTAGQDIETPLGARLFGPLGMGHAFVARPPAGARVAAGHHSTGTAAAAWNFPPHLSGVGGVRASLDDLVRYLEGHLGRGDAHVAALLARTHAPLDLGHAIATNQGMGWIPLSLAGRTILVHDGGTGGFTSFVALDLDRRRASVALADTTLINLGGLADVALHLLDPVVPLGTPRTVAVPPAALLARLAGAYELPDVGEVVLAARDGRLLARSGSDEIELGYDSHGDFFPLEGEGLLTPLDGADGPTFVWTFGGVPTVATRRSAGDLLGGGPRYARRAP
jgi:D-alanyl-D-alanine-carboxypeptidase/D-alanyl-D-alanine-endopeptidase